MAAQSPLDVWVSSFTAVLEAGAAVDLVGPNDPDVLANEPWPVEQQVPASAIRTALLRPPATVDPRGLVLRGAWITGALNLEDADIPFPVTLDHCVLAGGLTGEGCSIRRLAMTDSRAERVDLDGARVDRDLVIAKTTCGQVRAVGATIGGQLVLSGARLANRDGVALNLDGAEIRGSLLAGDGFTATGELRALDATIAGFLVLSGARLANPDGVALNLDWAEIRGSLLAGDGFTATGQVRALGATIGGQLDLSGANLANPDGVALNLDGAEVRGGLIARDGFTARGQVRALGATISEFVLSGACLANPDGVALNLDGAEISSRLVARDGFTATGQVRAIGATIGGQFVLSGARLANPDGVALALDVAEIRGDLFARAGFTAIGQLDLSGATIAGQLDLSGATLSNLGKLSNGKVALLLEQAKVQALLVDGITQCEGGVDLTACQLGDLVVNHEANGLPRLTGAAGWSVRDIHGHLRHDRSAAIAWLDTSDRFTTSPWEELARVYDRNGQPADARRVRFAAAHRTTRRAPWHSKLFRWLYASSVGYGYYPLLAAVWLLAAILTATALTAATPGAFLPTAATARIAAPPAGVACPSLTEPMTAADDPACRASGYPALHPLTYALATVSPASAVTPPAWAPLAPGAAWLETTLTALKLLGWLMTVLLLAGLTGLLRKG
ncbi:MAG: hypothetical protein L0H79_00545 [Intrasporangium sp.]|uniref:hypothetical protein n=1 Tax=Intrasporangium sp. TaxID=1925024 RepID=UPI0026490D24|nr:hypothetical protein [Intrasporangium sp.]MDN5794221.1 hypothetical protein [Intrasporangium sp.]